MSEAFDPYRKWLGIPPSQQPPHLYRLLGIELYEADVEVIDTAAGQRMSYLQELAGGQYVKESQKLLNEVSAARRLLLDAKKKAEYDTELKTKLAPTGAAAPAAGPTPPPVPLQAPPKHGKTALKKAHAPDDEETVTLNLHEATAKLKKQGLGLGDKASATKTSSKKGGKNEAKILATSHASHRKKSSPIPALVLLAVLVVGAAGAFLMRDKFRSAPAGEDEDTIHAVAPSAQSGDEYADYLLQMQKQESELQKKQGNQSGRNSSKRDGVKFTTSKTPATATGTAAAPSAATAASTAPLNAVFFAPPTGTADPKATGTGVAASAVDAKAAAAARGRVSAVPATDEATQKQNEDAFTPKEGLPAIATPKPTATATGTRLTPSAAKKADAAAQKAAASQPTDGATPTGTAAPTAMPTATAKGDDKPYPFEQLPPLAPKGNGTATKTSGRTKTPPPAAPVPQLPPSPFDESTRADPSAPTIFGSPPPAPTATASGTAPPPAATPTASSSGSAKPTEPPTSQP